jgi:beta-N-acetylhexosaminidase
VAYTFPGRVPPPWLERRIRRGEAGAVLLFAGNGTSAAAVRRLTARLQAVPRPPGLDAPLLVMTDQEGGRVARLQGPPDMPAAGLAARSPSVSLAQGAMAGVLLCRAGVNVNLAPVLDLALPGSVIAAQGRSLGRGPDAVARRGVAFARGLAQTGTVPVPKHFPGLGAARETTDDVPVVITRSRALVRGRDMRPYRPLIRRGVPAVMVGTAVYRAWGARPAALTPALVRGELRGRLGFGGVTVSDALDTPALAPWGSVPDVAAAAARAGIDLQLYAGPRAAVAAARGVRDALASGRLDRDAMAASVDRVLAVRRALAAPAPAGAGDLAPRAPAC